MEAVFSFIIIIIFLFLSIVVVLGMGVILGIVMMGYDRESQDKEQEEYIKAYNEKT